MTSLVDDQFTDWFNEIAQLYDDDKIEECILQSKKLLLDSACPRYHRIKTLVLVGDLLPWAEAMDYCREADALWHVVNVWTIPGHNDIADKALVDLRKLIDVAKEALEHDPDRPDEDVDYDTSLQENIAVYNAQVQEDKAVHEAEFGAENEFHEKMERDLQEMKSAAEEQLVVERNRTNVDILPQARLPVQVTLSNRSKTWSPNRRPHTTNTNRAPVSALFGSSNQSHTSNTTSNTPSGHKGSFPPAEPERREEIRRLSNWRSKEG